MHLFGVKTKASKGRVASLTTLVDKISAFSINPIQEAVEYQKQLGARGGQGLETELTKHSQAPSKKKSGGKTRINKNRRKKKK